MRASAAALLAIVAAVIGGLTVLLVGKSAGWFHSTSKTVVVRESIGDTGTGAPVVAAKPLVGNGFQPAQIYRRRVAGVVTIFSYFGSGVGADTSAAQGSGFVVSKRGVVLTNAHVITTAGISAGAVKPATTVYVEFADGDRVAATVAGYDVYDDVGVLKLDPKQHPLQPVPLGDSARVVVGQPVAAIGSPFGKTDSLTVGVVSAIRRSIPSLTARYDLIDAIQTDAPINHGNSGGPLFDARGRVVGINAQIRSSGADSGFEGVGFAVPIDSAKRSMSQILATGSVTYAYVGIRTEDLTPSAAKKFGYATRHGALVATVTPGSAGARAGLKAGTRDVVFRGLDLRVGGDAIVAINGEPVMNGEDVVRIVAEQLVPGQTARFTVVRGRQRRVVRVVLATRSP